MRERAMRIRADIDIGAGRERGTQVAVSLTASLAYDPAGMTAP
jgi:nitrate/nitrite-specific signal transduction histidine kinase